MSVDLSVLLGEMWTQLNAANAADGIFWTSAEFYQWFDETKNRLAKTVGGFVNYDTSLTTVLNQGSYTLPALHASTIQVDYAGTILRPRSVQQLEALDSSWPTTTGTPNAFVQNRQGTTDLTLYPAPNSASIPIGIVEAEIPAVINSGAPTISMPVPLRELFRFFALGEARGRESKGQMQDVSQWCLSIAAMMEKTALALYGGAE